MQADRNKILPIPHILGSRLTGGGEVISLSYLPRFTRKNIFTLLLLVDVTGRINTRA
jgi:hypothetical protein